MRKLLILGVSTILLSALAGCSTVQCAGQSAKRAGQSVGRAGQKVGCTVSNAWQKLECEACQQPAPVKVTCPVYADACCGGDSGIGRGGHGAFRIPEGPE